MRLKTTLFAATAAVALAPAAHAYEGLYGTIGAGLSYMGSDLDTEGTGALAFDSEGDYDNGIGVYTALGYAWGNGFRTELEYSYRQNDVRHWRGDGLDQFALIHLDTFACSVLSQKSTGRGGPPTGLSRVDLCPHEDRSASALRLPKVLGPPDRRADSQGVGRAERIYQRP